MDTTLRGQSSAMAEFSGRAVPAWRFRGRDFTPWTIAQCRPSGVLKHFVAYTRGCGKRQAGDTPRNVRSAALPEIAALPSSSTDSTTCASSGPSSAAQLSHHGMATAALTLSHTAAAAAVAVTLAEGDGGGSAVGAPALAHSMPASTSTSFGELGSPSSEAEAGAEAETDGEEAEMCTLVADPSGDVQVVCESDPGHPLSLAEVAVYRPPLSPMLLQDIEAKLEADLITIAVTILFAVGFISLEFGVNDLIEHYWGDSLLSDVVCVGVGLVVVFWVRLSKVRLMRFDRWR